MYEIAIQISPNNFITYFNKGYYNYLILGFCLRQLKDYDKAI